MKCNPTWHTAVRSLGMGLSKCHEYNWI